MSNRRLEVASRRLDSHRQKALILARNWKLAEEVAEASAALELSEQVSRFREEVAGDDADWDLEWHQRFGDMRPEVERAAAALASRWRLPIDAFFVAWLFGGGPPTDDEVESIITCAAMSAWPGYLQDGPGGMRWHPHLAPSPIEVLANTITVDFYPPVPRCSDPARWHEDREEYRRWLETGPTELIIGMPRGARLEDLSFALPRIQQAQRFVDSFANETTGRSLSEIECVQWCADALESGLPAPEVIAKAQSRDAQWNGFRCLSSPKSLHRAIRRERRRGNIS